MPRAHGRPLHEAPLGRVKAVFSDVDGTLTTQGKLESTTLKALEWLGAHGVPVVLVSGRPAGWAECWARQWPVAGVIAENGGLTFSWKGRRLVTTYAEPPAVRARHRAALERHVAAALKAVPGAKLSRDSSSTEVDLAIDYAEEARLGPAGATAIERFLRARGVTAVRSSVHVNCWLGAFDKRTAVEAYLEAHFRTALTPKDTRFLFVGDSFNDAPLFEAFWLSVGVANVADVWEELAARPAFVTRGREGKGFGELADAIARATRAKESSR